MRMLLWMAGFSCSLLGQQAEHAPAIADLPVSAQQGPSCAFFANLPMVAWATGYDVGASPAFVRSVYGLRRGDFAFQKSFDKRIFCELFSLDHEETEILYPPSVERDLLPQAELIVSSRFDKALTQGCLFSLRVKGLFGGAHNALLLGKEGDRYLVHDPRGGRMLKLSRKELAQMILVKSSQEVRSAKPSFVTNFLKVEVPKSPVARVLPAGDFARELDIEMSDAQREALKRALSPAPRVAGLGLAPWVGQYPAINFALIQDGQDELRSVISKDLAAEQMVGVLHLCQLTLNACQRGTRHQLPVLVLEGSPQVIVGYRTDPMQPLTTEWIVDDGVVKERMQTKTLLERFKASGVLYGTIPLMGKAAEHGPNP